MTIEQKVEYMKTMMSDTSLEDETAIVYLNLAKQKLINHIYPFDIKVDELDERYDYQQIELAIVLYNERGAEGEDEHDENGVKRRYRSEKSILASIPKYAGLPKWDVLK